MRLRALAPLALIALAAPSPAFAQSATPTVTTTPTSFQDPACARVFLESAPSVVNSGGAVQVALTVDSPSATNTVTLTRTQPTPSQDVRRVTTTERRVTFDLKIGETHEFVASASYGSSCVEGPTPANPPADYGQPRFTVQARPTLSIAARREEPRLYTFTGRVLPGRGQAVTLYRVTDDGTRVITSRGTVAANGTYSITRRFTGSGRFGFEVRVATSATNLAGASSVRPTVIH